MKESKLFPGHIDAGDLEITIREWQLIGISIVPLSESVWIVCDLADIKGTVCIYTETICGWSQDAGEVQKTLTKDFGPEMEKKLKDAGSNT